MMAWANRDALAQTLATGAAHFWSRSRRAPWRKGESSGNTLAVRDVRIDCDGDVVLYVVDAGRPVVPHGRHVVFLPPRRRRRRAGGGRRPGRSAVGHDRARRRRDRQAAPRAPREVVRRVAARRGPRQDQRQDHARRRASWSRRCRPATRPTPRTRRPTCCSTCWSAWKPQACRWTTSPPSCGAGSAPRGSTRRRAASNAQAMMPASCTRSWARAARQRRCCPATNRGPASSRWLNGSPPPSTATNACLSRRAPAPARRWRTWCRRCCRGARSSSAPAPRRCRIRSPPSICRGYARSSSGRACCPGRSTGR